MILRSSARRRPTDMVREAARLTDTVAAALGQTVRAGRKRMHLTQAALGSRVGVHQSWISRIELGRGQAVPLELWIRIGVALGQPLAISFSRPLGVTRHPVDAGHLAMQEYLLGLGRTTGRSASFELPTRAADPSHSVDVCLRDIGHRVLIIEEAWNRFGDFGAAMRAPHRKAAEAADLAATIDGGPPYRVATVWVVRDSAGNRAIIGRFPEIIAIAFPGSSRDWAVALTTSEAPPARSGLVWFDASTDRIHEWRRSPRLGRRA